MPLLHQERRRGGGGSSENPRLLADFLDLHTTHLGEPATPTDNHLSHERRRGGGSSGENPRLLEEFLDLHATHLGEPATATDNHRANEGVSDNERRDFRWEEPGSPEVAHTPRAFVPAVCFPPRHPRAFASYSESARPGGWEDPGQGITDIVASLKALAMPEGGGSRTAPSTISYDSLDTTMDMPWPPEQANTNASRDERLARRASFCGVFGGSDRLDRLGLDGGMRGALGATGVATGGGAARWAGSLPARCTDPNPSGGFSPKVFLGGLPWDITEHALMAALRPFQPVRVEWPGRECGGGGAGGGGGGGGAGDSPRGFAYVTLGSERCVRALLAASRRKGNDWYYRVASRKMRTKYAQVIPWAVSDSNWVVGGSVRLEPARTVFVGALHGMLSASALALIMNDLFSGVVYAGIDTDKNKYPIGSGRVTFNNVRSYVRAISAAYVEIITDKFSKKVQVDPYLEDSMCTVCNLQQGPYFCREPMCFRYFCRSCWMYVHAREKHKALMRNSKSAPALAPRAEHAGHAPHAPHAPHAHAHAHADHANLFGESYTSQSEGTPSPPTSGASGASGTSEYEGGPSCKEPADMSWPPH